MAKQNKVKQQKIIRDDINGILVLDKPKGISSNKAIQICKNLFNAKKVGHAGTLDPMASGLLLVLFGEACKFASYGLEAKKTYLATLQLGQGTTTGDAEGELTQTLPVPNLNLEQIKAKLNCFLGASKQIPPVYSALKHNGRKLYELALAGKAVEKPAREIFIYNLEFLNYAASEKCELEFSAEVSKGTYIRKLGEDFAQKLGTLGHLTALRRTGSGKLNLAMPKAIGLEQLEEQKRLGVYLQDFLYPVDFLLDELPSLELTADELNHIVCGRQIKNAKNLTNSPKISDNIKLYFGDEFIGLGILEQDTLIAKRLLNTELLL